MTDQYPPPSGPDTSAAFRGLLVGAVLLFIALFTIVKLTDAHFRAREAAEAVAK
jgi:hypothetical protein